MDSVTGDMSNFGKVAVLMGGLSAEREISLISGHAVYEALRKAGIDAYEIDVDKDILMKLAEGHFDRAFIALHGRGGEDGVIQGALEIMNIPYTGSGVIGSALAMDKSRTKRIWQSAGLPTPGFVEINESTDWDSVGEQLGFPLMVKPVHEGSSLGASKVEEAGELEIAWKSASKFDDRVMAEQWITGREYTVPILEDNVLPMIRLETPRQFYDYEAKYKSDSTRYICPCGLETSQEEYYGQIAMDAFNTIGASGWGRIDMMVDEQDQPWLIEVNTVPGMTSHSLVPMSASQAGIDFGELSLRILNTSMQEG